MSIKSYFKKLFKKKEEPPVEFILSPGITAIDLPSGVYSYAGGFPIYGLPDTYGERIKIIEEQKNVLNSFDNNVKVLFEDIKKYTVLPYFNMADLNRDIEICKVIDRHLKLNKFNNTLEDIINE